MRKAIRVICLVVFAMLAGASLAQASELSFEQRVAAQRAIEQVYYRHQIGATKSFEEAVPHAVLEGKVQKYLQQTVALEVYWKTPVTDEMLGRELERMTRGSRLPDRLEELFAALGNDPFLIKECLARASLVDRLARNFYASDATLHAEARQRAEELQRQLAQGEIDPSSDHPDRSVVDLVMREAKAGEPQERERTGDLLAGDRLARRELSPEEFRKERARLPDAAGSVAPVADERDAFVIRVVLSDAPGEVRAASYVVPKMSWDLWWESAKKDLRGERVAAVALDGGSLPSARSRASGAPGRTSASAEWDVNALSGAGLPCADDDTWDNGNLDDVPDPRHDHTAVWTGSLMVVWGGTDYSGYPSYAFNTGGRYDPATGTWTATSTVGAPLARYVHTAVWTGSVMLVWGGNGDIYTSMLNTGGRYDPVTDTWRGMSTVGAPSARLSHTAVWTGSVMVVWGGGSYDGGPPEHLNTGGRYDPATDTWTATSTVGAPAGRDGHTAVWTGSVMVVWGGHYYDGADHYVNTGGRYDPATNTWTGTSTVRAPSARAFHTAIWTGTAMVVWGGSGNQFALNTGGRYDPATDTWTSTSSVGAPSKRYHHTAVWTDSVMVVWGGDISYFDDLNTGGRYDPATDTWTATSTLGAPSGRQWHTAVWTGSVMVVWGGVGSNGYPNTGGRYDPATDTWTATSTVGAPSARSRHTAVWTGSVMVVWGGVGLSGYPNIGGRYDPATDTWTATTTVDAPSARARHTAVWTGSVMVVWGGSDSSYNPLNTGGRYDPATDTWTATSTVGAPSGRWHHAAVWTASVMVIWGGHFYDGTDHLLDTGGRYDPETDAWTPTSPAGAPSGRVQHTAVWTGSVMVVWGGYEFDNDVGDHYLNTGGRYDPAADTWTATSTVGAPSGRVDHTAVWTGSVMVVWGGVDGVGVLGSGGRYILVDTEDSDGDGVCNAEDQCPATVLTPTVVIRTCDSGVGNYLFPDGCNFGDRIGQCLAGASNHGGFVSCVAHLADGWKGAGPITGRDGSRILSCAAQQQGTTRNRSVGARRRLAEDNH